MKKIASITLFLLGLSCTALAQNPIPNAGFENWNQIGISVPNAWMTIGNYASDSSKTVGNGKGIKLINNKLSQTISYVLQVGSDYPNPILGGFPVSGTPSSIKINYNSTELGNDTAIVIIGFTKGVDLSPIILQQFVIIADPLATGDNSKTIALTYSHPTAGLVADSGFIYIASSSGIGKPNESGNLKVYDISFPDGKTAPTANLGFENWGGLKINRPSNWYTSLDAFEDKIAKATGIQSFALQSNDARNGTAIELKQRIVTTNSGTETIPAWLITQDPTISEASMSNPSFNVNQRYNSVRGYYKGKLIGGDRFTMIVNFFNADTMVGSGLFSQNSFGSVPTAYTLFSENIVWLPNFSGTPTKATVGIFLTDSNFQTASNPLSKILIDDISLDLNFTNSKPVTKQQVVIQTYPNPSQGIFYVKSPELIRSVFVISQNGQLVQQLNQINAKEIRIEIPEVFCKSGIYWLQVVGDNSSTTQGIVIQN